MINPFLNSTQITVIKKEFITRTTIPQGDVSTILKETTEYRASEASKFVKAYKYSYQLGLIKQLNTPGCKLYLYIQAKLELNADIIRLPRDRVAQDLDVSVKTISNGILNLCDNGVICRKGQSSYWINPKILFNGDRFDYFKTNKPENINYVKDPKPTIYNLTKDDSDKMLMY